MNEQNGSITGAASKRDWTGTALVAAAVLVAGLIAVQLSRFVGGSPALADQVSTYADHTMLTVDSGSGEDVVVVLDQRGETLMIYRCPNQRSLEFKGQTDIRQLFFEARRSGK